MIETLTYRCSTSRITRRIAAAWCAKRWWAFALPLGALLIAGTYDARFFIVAAAVALIVYPGILTLVFFKYALTPAMAKAVLPQKATISPDGVRIDYEADDAARPATPTVIPRADIAEVAYDGTDVAVYAKGEKTPAATIPGAAFADKSDIARVLEWFS